MPLFHLFACDPDYELVRVKRPLPRGIAAKRAKRLTRGHIIDRQSCLVAVALTAEADRSRAK
jgi:hypothetical protein